jgi:hypothetical protein
MIKLKKKQIKKKNMNIAIERIRIKSRLRK